MVDRSPDIIFELYLSATWEGGRSHDVSTPTWKCRIAAAGRLFDVLIDTGGRRLTLGSTNRVRAYFLDWSSASNHVCLGANLAIFELNQVGEAKIVEITDLARASA